MGVWCGGGKCLLLSWRILNGTHGGGGGVSGLQTVCVGCGQSGRVQLVVLPVAESGKRYHDEIHACISAVEQTCRGPGRGQEEVYPWVGGAAKVEVLNVCVCAVVWVGGCMHGL